MNAWLTGLGYEHWALSALLIIPVLEAATRGWRRRALVTFALLCVGYMIREIVVSQVYSYNQVTLDSVTYRLGVLGQGGVEGGVSEVHDRLARHEVLRSGARESGTRRGGRAPPVSQARICRCCPCEVSCALRRLR